jgi:hypothetical protein
MVWPESSSGEGADAVKYRFNWTAPIVLSPHDPNVLYQTGNRVFRSRDEGASWDAISPDLSRNDKSRLGASGGPITKDNTGAEYYGTVFAFAESPLQRGVLWAASDDGLVHVSRDDGKSWKNVTTERHRRVGADVDHRGVAARSRGRVSRGDAVQDGRLPPVPVQDEGLRPVVDEDHERYRRR